MQIKVSDLIDLTNDEVLENWSVYETTDWTAEGKWQYRTIILLHGERFYKYTEERSGSYHTEYFYPLTEDYSNDHMLDLQEVSPIQITKIAWMNVIDGNDTKGDWSIETQTEPQTP